MARVRVSNGSGWVGDIGGKEQREKRHLSSGLLYCGKKLGQSERGGTDRYVLEVTTQLGPL